MKDNKEALMRRREENGIPPTSGFDEEVIKTLEEGMENAKTLRHYTDYNMEPVYLIPPETLFKHTNIASYLDELDYLGDDAISRYVGRTMDIMIHGSPDAYDRNDSPTEKQLLEILETSDIPSGIKWELYLLITNKKDTCARWVLIIVRIFLFMRHY